MQVSCPTPFTSASIIAATCLACSSGLPSDGGTGGTSSNGGMKAIGGKTSSTSSAPASGGSAGARLGGAAGSVTSTNGAGTTGIAGATVAGGATASGGMTPETGGALTIGGASNGGAVAVAGSTSAVGGNSLTGGAATGGVASIGGAAAGSRATAGMGGVSGGLGTGGAKSTGGAVATGGSLSTGGSVATGGVTATGGVRATGGTETLGAAGVAGATQPGSKSCRDTSGPECDGASCCESIALPGGAFPMGSGTETCPTCTEGCPTGVICPSTDRPEHEVTLSPFLLDKYPVTVGRYRKFVAAYANLGGRPGKDDGAHPHIPSSGWQSDWDSQLPVSATELVQWLDCESNGSWAKSDDLLPITCVGWYESMAFCIWDGGRLPTEAEWEYAAAGGSQNRLYPWGSTPAPSCSRVNYDQCGNGGPVPVTSLTDGAGRWGHIGLLGNVLQWVLDWYVPAWYQQPAAVGEDIANLTVPDPIQRSLRGGSWGGDITYLRSAYRHSGWLSRPNSSGLGFRCARNL